MYQTFFFLKSDMIHSRTTAPTTDMMSVPIMPPAVIPKSPYNHPPKTLPTRPIIKLIKKPNPLPFINQPAIAPAETPIIIDQIIP